MKKRKREIEKRSEIRCINEELSLLVKQLKPAGDNKDEEANIPAKPFLSLFNYIIQVLDKIGPTMAVLRKDIHKNIQSLEKMMETDRSKYLNLVEIMKKEVNEGNAKKGSSCSKALLWLTRSLDFTMALLQKIKLKESELSLEEAVEESYNLTLKSWHGWISSAAFKIALKLVPDSKDFIDILKENDESTEALMEEIQILISLLLPFLENIHSILKVYKLDQLKSI